VHHPHQLANLIAAVATGIHHMFAGDVAVRRVYYPFAVGLLRQSGHRRLPINLSAFRPRLAYQRMAEWHRINVAVERVPERPQQVVLRDEGVATGALGGVEDFELNAHPACHGNEVVVAVEMMLGRG